MKKRILPILVCLVFVFACFAFAGCNGSQNQYTVTVKASHYNLGSVEGGNNKYLEGETITIKATPATSSTNNSNPEFICWLLDNKVVTTNAIYEFAVSAQTAGTYVALFSCEYLEYFALSQIQVDTAITDGINANITSLSLELGTIENLTTQVYYLEPTATEQVITLNATDIYATDANPFAYDMQEDIYVKFILTYEQDGVTFVSTTSTKIAGINDVTQNSISLPITNLNLATNPQNADIAIDLAQTATLSLNFARLTTFQLPEPETI